MLANSLAKFSKQSNQFKSIIVTDAHSIKFVISVLLSFSVSINKYTETFLIKPLRNINRSSKFFLNISSQ